jgi:hypothetical protein
MECVCICVCVCVINVREMCVCVCVCVCDITANWSPEKGWKPLRYGCSKGRGGEIFVCSLWRCLCVCMREFLYVQHYCGFPF